MTEVQRLDTGYYTPIEIGKFESNYDEVTETFDDMQLKSELLRGVYVYGFECPTPIQQRAIAPVIRGKDVIAQAQSGTGMTAAICISILQKIDPSIKASQALIVVPTRQVARQNYDLATAMSCFMQIECHVCMDDAKDFQDGPQVVFGTPGRIQSMIQRRILKTDSIKTLVLNKADEILSRGFTDQIYDIFQLLPRSIQTVLFSTTILQDVRDVANKFMHDPIRILAKSGYNIDDMKHFYMNVEWEDQKLDTFYHLFFESVTTTKMVVFCNTRRKAEWLTDKLTTRQIVTSMMHGDMMSLQRAPIMEEFTCGSFSRVLIATNLLARGIDLEQISLVINFDLPVKAEDYIHRVGRKGITINFATTDDVHILHEIEQLYTTEVREMPVNVADLI